MVLDEDRRATTQGVEKREKRSFVLAIVLNDIRCGGSKNKLSM